MMEEVMQELAVNKSSGVVPKEDESFPNSDDFVAASSDEAVSDEPFVSASSRRGVRCRNRRKSVCLLNDPHAETEKCLFPK